MMLRVFLFLLSFVVLFAQPTYAKSWVVDTNNSYLGFVAKQSDATVKGRFAKFDATIDFDPADPQKGKITAKIDLLSLLSDTAEVKSNLPTSDFFDSKKFPFAVYTSNFIDNGSEHNCYKATGDLSLKGISKEVVLNFCLTPEDTGMRAKGEATLMRNEFNVGIGQWADEAMISNPVKVVMDIVAK